MTCADPLALLFAVVFGAVMATPFTVLAGVWLGERLNDDDQAAGHSEESQSDRDRDH